VGRKGEENVFSERFCQVYDFPAFQIRLTGEVLESHRHLEAFQAGNASHLESCTESSRGKNAPFTEPDVQRVGQRSAGFDQAVLEEEDLLGVFPFNVSSFRRYLEGVDFHGF
jgi:hypothetical protein